MPLADQEVTQADLADVLGLSDRHLRNLKKTIAPAGKRGTALVYRLGPAVQAYCAHLQNATQAKYNKKDLEEARIRQEIAKADKEEALARSALVAAKRDEEAVVEVSQVQEELEGIFSNVKAKLRAIPSKVAGWLAGLVGEELAIRIQHKLEELIDETLAELARPGEEEASPEGGTGDP